MPNFAKDLFFDLFFVIKKILLKYSLRSQHVRRGLKTQEIHRLLRIRGRFHL